MAVTSNIHSVGAAAGAALAALLRGAPRTQQTNCSEMVRSVAFCYLYLFQTIFYPSLSRVLEEFWQRAIAPPFALAAIVEALQVALFLCCPVELEYIGMLFPLSECSGVLQRCAHTDRWDTRGDDTMMSFAVHVCIQICIF